MINKAEFRILLDFYTLTTPRQDKRSVRDGEQSSRIQYESQGQSNGKERFSVFSKIAIYVVSYGNCGFFDDAKLSRLAANRRNNKQYYVITERYNFNIRRNANGRSAI